MTQFRMAVYTNLGLEARPPCIFFVERVGSVLRGLKVGDGRGVVILDSRLVAIEPVQLVWQSLVAVLGKVSLSELDFP